MTFSALLVLGWMGLAPEPPGAVPPPPPPPPAATAQPTPPPPPPPPPPAAQPVPAPATPQPVPAPATAQPVPAPNTQLTPATQPAGQTGPPPRYDFSPGAKSEAITPCTHGDAKVEEGKIEVTPEANSLKVVLTGAAGANVFLGAHSQATQTFQLVQEFDITSTNPSITQVVLTLESNLAGFVRSKHKGTACVRLASAVVSPAGWASAPLSVSYPTYCVTGAQGYKYETPVDPVKSAPLPLGRYVLQANFVISAEAGGLLDGHSTAIFVPESEALDPWEREHDPFNGDSHDGYGFTLTLKADTPPGFPPVAKKKTSKKVASKPRARNRATR